MQRSRFALWGTLALLLVAPAVVQGEDDASARKPIDRALDTFHDAASKADGERYFAQMTRDAVFLGTDATERWPRAAFEAFAKPYFEKGQGWSYTSTTRHIDIEANGTLAWFDELLENEHYGTCRGSGVLRKQDGGWRIAQYNLSIPIPNPLARDVVAQIRAGENTATSDAVIYVVRHADRDAGEDPDLNAKGRARATQLGNVLRSAGIDRIFATEYKRTQQTVAPTAKRAGIDVERYVRLETKALAEAIKKDTKSKAMLVAAHSRTAPVLLQHLGVTTPVKIWHHDYDNLFVVTLRPGRSPHFQHLHYGAVATGRER